MTVLITKDAVDYLAQEMRVSTEEAEETLQIAISMCKFPETEASKQRKQDIQEIDNLFPIDSPFDKTNAVGAQLLIDSILEYGWRNLPSDLLAIYANRCRTGAFQLGE